MPFCGEKLKKDQKGLKRVLAVSKKHKLIFHIRQCWLDYLKSEKNTNKPHSANIILE